MAVVALLEVLSLVCSFPYVLGVTLRSGSSRLNTTPHDELMGMGQVALNHHLHSCERDLAVLQSVQEHAIEATAAQIEKGRNLVEALMKKLEDTKDFLKIKRNRTLAEIKKLEEDIRELETVDGHFKTAYNAAFSDWYKLKEEVTQKTSRMESCKCSHGVLLQHSQQGHQHDVRQQRIDLQSADVAETVLKIEQCERDVDAMTGDIAAAHTDGRHATVEDANVIAELKQRIFDQEHLDKLMPRNSRLEGLREIHATMLDIVEQQSAQVKVYRKAKDQMEASLKRLEAEMKNCGCH